MLTAYAAASAERLGGLLAMIGAVGVAVLAAALVLRIPALVTPALALLGAEYAGLFVVRGDTLDVRAPLYGAAFLVVESCRSGPSSCGRAGRSPDSSHGGWRWSSGQPPPA